MKFDNCICHMPFFITLSAKWEKLLGMTAWRSHLESPILTEEIKFNNMLLIHNKQYQGALLRVVPGGLREVNNFLSATKYIWFCAIVYAEFMSFPF